VKKLLLATGAIFALASPAFAVTVTSAPVRTNLIENVRSDCRWVDNKWTYQRGDKRLVCRPDRPSGNGWGWHREGNRFGWYHAKRKEWNHTNW